MGSKRAWILFTKSMFARVICSRTCASRAQVFQTSAFEQLGRSKNVESSMTVYVYYGWLHPAAFETPPTDLRYRIVVRGEILAFDAPIKKLAYRKVAWQRRNFCCFPKHSHSKASRDSGSYQHCYLGLSLFSGFPSGRDAAGAGSSLARGSKQSEKVGRFPASLLVLDFLGLRSPRPSASCLSDTRCICRWSCCRARGPKNNCKLQYKQEWDQ